MQNIAKLKIILFDFDDTLCIHTDHTSGGDEEYNAKMVVGGYVSLEKLSG
jgi:hypothetical protein